MRFERLIEIVGDEPCFETGLLLAGEGVRPADVRRQLSRWCAAGRVIQLRRGVYCLAPPYRKVVPHPFVLANAIVRASTVSLQSALAWHGMIPEYTPVTTSVTTRRAGHWSTPLGDFHYRHIRIPWLRGYRLTDLGGPPLPGTGRPQHAFVATPAKALLDLVYFTAGGDSRAYLESLRLSNLERVDMQELAALAEASARPKLVRAVGTIRELAAEEWEGYREL